MTIPQHLTGWEDGRMFQSAGRGEDGTLLEHAFLQQAQLLKGHIYFMHFQRWMENHHLKLKPGKTELIFIPTQPHPPVPGTSEW